MDNDLISRSALIDKISYHTARDSFSRYDFARLFDFEATKSDMFSYVVNAPAVDAVEVVRCKDCKYWGIGYGVETENIKACCFASYMVGKNGYCVYGERKMDAEVNDVD